MMRLQLKSLRFEGAPLVGLGALLAGRASGSAAAAAAAANAAPSLVGAAPVAPSLRATSSVPDMVASLPIPAARRRKHGRTKSLQSEQEEQEHADAIRPGDKIIPSSKGDPGGGGHGLGLMMPLPHQANAYSSSANAMNSSEANVTDNVTNTRVGVLQAGKDSAAPGIMRISDPNAPVTTGDGLPAAAAARRGSTGGLRGEPGVPWSKEGEVKSGRLRTATLAAPGGAAAAATRGAGLGELAGLELRLGSGTPALRWSCLEVLR